MRPRCRQIEGSTELDAPLRFGGKASGKHSFVSFEHARRELSAWIRWYNEERPHQALGYRSPRDF
jgi:transposase InsO family protein